jgi:hypothetical protein
MSRSRSRKVGSHALGSLSVRHVYEVCEGATHCATASRTMLTIGTILYVSLLLINAMAVLSEDRFLARSKNHHSLYFIH